MTDPVSKLLQQQPAGRSLLRGFYTEPAVYRAELARIVYPNWFVAGHQSEWQAPGDFRVFEVADESAIIVLGEDGELRAFANVCRHRGSRVCLEPSGTTRAFSCPYHGWKYSLDGALVAARSMPDGFDKSDYGLRPVSIGIVHGIVLICFSDSPPSLDGAVHDLEEPMHVLDFEGMKVAARRSYAIPANWKLAVENYQECYHCSTSHPEYARMHTLTIDHRRRGPLQDALKDKLADSPLPDRVVDRLDTKARDGEMGYGYSRTALFEGYLTGSRDGQPVAPLLGELTSYDGGASDFSFGAFSFMLAYSDHVVCYVFKPVDLENCCCEITWFVRGDAEASKDYDVDELVWLWDITTQADMKIITDNYAGVKSRYYEPGPFSEMEAAESVYVSWLLTELGRVTS
ncbi:MAG: aromatic ring-hydroxylating dioxygenase subunit alpha [Woeseiaceae bacterium]|nr:aromatic ring-hydroxylating dioxygenase subunit alpha [Woeseiaceae bacterium]